MNLVVTNILTVVCSVLTTNIGHVGGFGDSEFEIVRRETAVTFCLPGGDLVTATSVATNRLTLLSATPGVGGPFVKLVPLATNVSSFTNAGAIISTTNSPVYMRPSDLDLWLNRHFLFPSHL